MADNVERLDRKRTADYFMQFYKGCVVLEEQFLILPSRKSLQQRGRMLDPFRS